MGEHRRGTVLVLAVAAACLLAAGIGGYGALAVLDRDAFADRAVRTLDSDEVREEAGVRIAGRLANEQHELSVLQPLIADTVSEDGGRRSGLPVGLPRRRRTAARGAVRAIPAPRRR